MATMRARKEEDDSADLPFQLGEMVLCRYSSYPFWPATIDESHQKKYMGKFHRRIIDKKGQRVLVFWCTFSNEDTGGWVRSDRMIRFHPDILPKIQVSKDHDEYDNQLDALQAAKRDYETLHEGKGDVEVPKLSPQLERLVDGEDDEEDDLGIESSDSEDEEQGAERDPGDPVSARKPAGKRRKSTGSSVTTARKQDVRPKAKKEPKRGKRKATAPTSPRPKKKARASAQTAKVERKRSKKDVGMDEDSVPMDVAEAEEVATGSKKRKLRKGTESERPSGVTNRIEELERDLEARNTTITKLKRSLRKLENKLAEVGSSSVRVNNPPQPEIIELPLPPRTAYRSEEMTSDKFTEVITELKAHYDKFQADVNKAAASRNTLEEETKAVQEKFVKVINNVKTAEKKAVESESHLAQLLRRVLLADIKVSDLRAHKAGNFVKAMGKKCKDMPLISSFCDAIYSTWMDQVLAHLDETNKESNGSNEKSKKQESVKLEPETNTDVDATGADGEKSSRPPVKEGVEPSLDEAKRSDKSEKVDKTMQKGDDAPSTVGTAKERDREMTELTENAGKSSTSAKDSKSSPHIDTGDERDVAAETVENAKQSESTGQIEKQDSGDAVDKKENQVDPADDDAKAASKDVQRSGDKEPVSEQTMRSEDDKPGSALKASDPANHKTMDNDEDTQSSPAASPKQSAKVKQKEREDDGQADSAAKSSVKEGSPVAENGATRDNAPPETRAKEGTKGISSPSTAKQAVSSETPRSVTVTANASSSQPSDKPGEQAVTSKTHKDPKSVENAQSEPVGEAGKLPPSAGSKETAAS